MRNGEYNLVIAPEGYPGKLYRNRYCYEHHLVYWLNYGIIPKTEEIIHHKDGNKRNNDINNLELMNRISHIIFHEKQKTKNMVLLMCPTCQKIFSREKRQTHLDKPNNEATYCSRKCAAIASNLKDKTALKKNIENNVIKEYTAP